MGTTARPTWLGSDRFVPRALARPLVRFLHIEASSGVLLLIATVVALVWANSPWQHGYEELWHTHFSVDLGGHAVGGDLHYWVNDALMALFFFVVGLEIKRELVAGQLAKPRDAALPAIAALGGMVLPALIYVALNLGGDGANGWGIPMATDIAFAVGVLALMGNRVPPGLKILLLGLAIVDDIGAIAVIAVFYTDDLDTTWALAAIGGLVAVGILRKVKVWYIPVYAVVGSFVWLAMLNSGIHATIAGVALGLMTPARPLLGQRSADAIADRLSDDQDVTASEIREVHFELRESVSVAERIQDVLHPWTSYVVIPVFALSNAGVELSSDMLADAVTSPVAIGIVLGLVVGKLFGVWGAITLARKGGFTPPAGVTGRHVFGMSGLAGIGFTVALFIAGLAFDDPALQAEAKVGILTASLISAVLGSVILRRMPALPGDGGIDDVEAYLAAEEQPTPVA